MAKRSDDRSSVRAYVEARQREKSEAAPSPAPAVRHLARQLATGALTGQARRKAGELAASRPLQLHLGSGGNNLAGWVNVDLVGTHADVRWDLRRPLPFADGSADAVFLEHVLEDLTVVDGMTLLAHCRRALAPGGVLRIGVPDAGMYADRYARHDPRLEELRPGRPTPMLALSEVFQEHGHLSAWDGATLVLVVTEAGFDDAGVTPGGSSPRLDPAPDSPSRIPESVYVEAVRPAGP